jgi:putative ABC transport system substrate-binding protein
MRRRGFAGLLAGASLWPFAGHGETARIGYVYTGPRAIANERIAALRSGLTNAEVVSRVTDGDPAKIAPMVSEVLASTVALFVASGPAVLRAVHARTKTVPIIASDLETDPVAEGYARSLARPGGNVTGVFLDFPDFAGKWLELLRETVPRLARVALLWDPGTGRVQVDAVARAASALRLATDLLEVRIRADYAAAFAAARERGAGAAILSSSPLVSANVAELAELSVHHKLPSITMFSEFPRAGGLLSYGPNLGESYRQIGALAAKVLAGSAPADLPIQRPSRFELIVNLRAAAALGLVIPVPIQGRADEVIE